MESKEKIRNHISIIFESAARTFWVLLFVFVGNFIGNADSENAGMEFLAVLGVVAAVAVVSLLWQVVVWAKTYIYIQENTLVVEKVLLNRKKNTIGMKNISNINLEQNLFEMLIGTCKVKLDTNSLSTADQTDVKIVLKKKDAEEFKQKVLCKIEGTEIVSDLEEEGKQGLAASMDDIVAHGLFSVRISMVVLMMVVVIAAGILGTEMVQSGEITGTFEIALTILGIVWAVGGWLWKILKEFVKYLDFKIERRGDKIFQNYGVFKKVAYSIPVEKINAVRLKQTFIARIGKRYMVEIINVGMGDDEGEAQSFLLPYTKMETLKEQLNLLLPEFADCMEIQEERQPKCVWWLWIPAIVIYVGAFAVALWVTGTYEPEASKFLVLTAAGLGVWLVIVKMASYYTVGRKVSSRFLKVVSGAFGRNSLYVKYDKIQYLTTKQNVLEKHFRVQKGTIFLLASMTNRAHTLPYFTEEERETLKEYIIKK